MSLNLVMKACLTTSTATSDAITMTTSGNSTHRWSKIKHIKSWSVSTSCPVCICIIYNMDMSESVAVKCWTTLTGPEGWTHEEQSLVNFSPSYWSTTWGGFTICTWSVLVTWVPWKLLHVSQTDDEQEDVVGEPLFYVCGKQTNQSWINLLCTHCGRVWFHKFTLYWINKFKGWGTKCLRKSPN